MGCRTSRLGAAIIKTAIQPDELSVAASGVFIRDENAVHSEPVDSSESETGDSASEASESIALDPSDKAVIYRAADRAKLPSQAASTSTSAFDSGPQRRKSEGLPILPNGVAVFLEGP